MKVEDCIFCKIANKETETKIIRESPNFIAFYDIHPISEGHTLIIPKKHFVSFLDIPDSLGGELHEFIKQLALDIISKNKAEGFNLLMRNLKAAGQEIMHAHIHLIPRKKGDRIDSLPV